MRSKGLLSDSKSLLEYMGANCIEGTKARLLGYFTGNRDGLAGDDEVDNG